MKTIFHPKTNELSATITEDGNLLKVDTGHRYMYDHAETMDEAIQIAYNLLNEIYSGSYARDMAHDRAYSRQEQIACGNW